MTAEAKLATALVTAVGGAVTGAIQTVTGTALDGRRVTEYVMVGALGLIGVLLRAAWKDLQERDSEARRVRRDIWKAVNQQNARLAAVERELAIRGNRKHRE